MNPRLVIVSNRLPISVKKVDGKLEFFPSIGGLATGLASYANNKNNRWIGWPGIASDKLTESERKEITKTLKKSNCYPVFLTQKEIDSYYNGYSNGFLWPLFHDIAVAPEVMEHEELLWKSYVRVNKKFADITLALSAEKDRIWVHDYQLLLLPKYLRNERPEDEIGIFSHIPFPDTKIFGSLNNATEIVTSMLQANLVGFHTQSYVRNFLDSVELLTPFQIENTKVVHGKHVSEVTDFPIGIDYTKYTAALKTLSAKKELLKLRVKYGRKKVILTVDRLDPAKGLVERVTAYMQLLQENPKFHTKVVLVMLVVPSRTEIDAYKKLKINLEALITETNKKFGTSSWQPIDYMYTSLPFERVTALYQRAEIAFIVPLRDGMNLVAKEYLASKKRQNGVLILSKTAGAAEDLKEAIVVDPSQTDSVVAGLKQALEMPKNELKWRVTKMQKQISTATVQKWAQTFLTTLKDEKFALKPLTRRITPTLKQHISVAFKISRFPILLLDYDGVLEPLHRNPENAKPSEILRNLLYSLSKKANVVVVSGRPKRDLEPWLGDLPITLVAEHGMYSKKTNENTWHKSKSEKIYTWKKEVQHLLEAYAAKAPGSFVEVKDASIAWHYRKTSSYHAQKYLVILHKFLKPIAKKHSLLVAEGHAVLEVRPKGINKGIAAVKQITANTDFILCIGDDYTDEDMFKALPRDAYTIKVGRGITEARMRLQDSPSVIELLKQLL